jgi:DNA-binding transcriptional LysR family regulator
MREGRHGAPRATPGSGSAARKASRTEFIQPVSVLALDNLSPASSWRRNARAAVRHFVGFLAAAARNPIPLACLHCRPVDTKWLEDFVSLAQTRSFSRSAQLRNVTQPAFSRRIQALEAWAGVDLVDRSTYPTRLTVAGESFLAQAHEMLASLQTTRNLLLSHQSSGSDMIDFALPHTLAFAFFPQWLLELRHTFPQLKTRLIALNVHDAVLRLTEGHCDLLLVYDHPSQPLQLAPERYEMLTLGQETLAPFSRMNARTNASADSRASGEAGPLWRLPGTPGARLPFLSYASGAYMAHLVEHILKAAPQPPHLDLVYETDMAESLKAMVLEGHGLAFLPASSVRKDVRARRLALAFEARSAHRWQLTMDVRIVRERPQSTRGVKPGAAALWQHLAQAAPTS